MVLFILLVTSIYADSANYNKGEMLYFSKVCNGCHGVDALGGGVYPKLANKKKKYLKERLYYFKKGKVSTQNQEMMVQFILNFSDEDIENIATFLSEHKKRELRNVAEDLFGGYGS